jgi:hypothetical protein
MVFETSIQGHANISFEGKASSLSLNKIVPATPFSKMSIFAEMQSSDLPHFCFVFLQIMHMVHYTEGMARVMGWEGNPYMNFTRVLIKAIVLAFSLPHHSNCGGLWVYSAPSA